MADFTVEMAAVSAARARLLADKVSDLTARARSAPPVSPLRLSGAGFDVIAEAKLASPADGRLASGGKETVRRLIVDYEHGGACAVSVLTEESRFGGSLSHLEAASSATRLPVMRKDFLVDPLQVLEARAFGASGVLIVARILSPHTLAEMVETTLGLGMFALVEAFDRQDLQAAAVVSGQGVLVGVNARNLATLDIDPARFEELAPELPREVPWVAESGIRTAAEARRASILGYRIALVGSALVTAADPASLLGEMIDSGRRAASETAT